MSLDASTLTFAGGFVSCLSGLFLLAYWWQDRTGWPAFWWGLANSGLGIGVSLLGLQSVMPFYVSHIVAPLLLDLSAVVAFVAARIFNRGSVDLYRVIAIVALWITMRSIFGGIAPEQYAAALGAGTSGALFVAAAGEFWLGRGEALRGRRPMIGILAAYALSLFLLALQFASTTDYVPLPPDGWLGAVNFVGLVYALGVTVFLSLMLKGRSEGKFRIAALVDPLTGLANRRAFMDRAQRVLDRGGNDAGPVALLAFDLDRFKNINDTFGHATGDQVLRAFADVLSSMLRPTNILARLGGEEFVAVVPGADNEAAVAIATRICIAFQNAGHFVNGQKIDATVSVGVATNRGQMCDLSDLLASADGAMYEAKNAGRNRVMLARQERARLLANDIIRIA